MARLPVENGRSAGDQEREEIGRPSISALERANQIRWAPGTLGRQDAMMTREQQIAQLRADLERLARGGHAGSSTYFLVQLELQHLRDAVPDQ